MQAWRVAVPIVAAAAGLLFTTSASSAHGTDLRNDRVRLTDLIAQQERTVADAQRRLGDLQASTDAAAKAAAA
ncbi:MAG: hypothetical protein QOI42_128, partial [Frankiaceae bacterium]|nr:hypothetical protein [Frankiaceae bacterium]